MHVCRIELRKFAGQRDKRGHVWIESIAKVGLEKSLLDRVLKRGAVPFEDILEKAVGLHRVRSAAA